MSRRAPTILTVCGAIAVSMCAGCGGTGGPADAAAAGRHPSLMLNRATLRDLRSRARRGTPEWKALRSVCDSFKRGHVELPDGQGYPDNGGIGPGYQGDGYYPNLMAIGLCYQTATGVDRRRAKRYGQLGAELVSKMATEGRHAAVPTTDDVYGIRNYGVGLAIGYDWLYKTLKPSVRTRVRRVEKRWITTYQRKGFGHSFPQGNYFAGYYAASGLAALAMGRDHGAPITWSQWLKKVQGPVARYYEANLAGGGWPEGWNYGPIATMNQELPVLAARTAKGIDLTRSPSPYRFPLGSARYLLHFTWPDRSALEDSGAVYPGDIPTATPAWLYSVQAAVLAEANDPFAAEVRNFAHSLPQSSDAGLGPAWPAWIKFLFDRGGAESDFTKLDTSYLAQGMDMAAMRSSWDTSAVWGAFIGGPYINNPDNGEEYFDKGGLTIMNGSRPFLVNSGGALQRSSTPGADDGDKFQQQVYDDLFGDSATRSIFNIFYVSQPTPLGQGEVLRSQGAHTRMSAFEDAGGAVFARSTGLEDEYPQTGAKTISRWTREVVYLRPGTFVVHDRTAVTDPALDQWLAFHLSGAPQAAGGDDGGVSGYDVTAPGGYAGRVHVVLPAGHRENTVDLFNGGKVFRLEVRGSAAAGHEWLTVFDAAPSAGDASSALPANVVSGPMSGVVLRRSGGNQAVLLSQREADQPVTEEIAYRVPAAATRHLIAGLQPGASYQVTAAKAGNEVELHVRPGGGIGASANGVLRLSTDAAGNISPG